MQRTKHYVELPNTERASGIPELFVLAPRLGTHTERTIPGVWSTVLSLLMSEGLTFIGSRCKKWSLTVRKVELAMDTRFSCKRLELERHLTLVARRAFRLFRCCHSERAFRVLSPTLGSELSCQSSVRETPLVLRRSYISAYWSSLSLIHAHF